MLGGGSERSVKERCLEIGLGGIRKRTLDERMTVGISTCVQDNRNKRRRRETHPQRKSRSKIKKKRSKCVFSVEPNS